MMIKKIRVALKFIRICWIVFGLSLLLLFFADTSFYVFFRMFLENNSVEKMPADIYANNEWTLDYFNELERARSFSWKPYVYWSKKPFKGKYINIDKQGDRITWNNQDSSKDPAKTLRIYVFGGSTVWGIGSRDDYTIPSYISKGISNKGVDVIVKNFGEDGFVSSQSLIKLLLLLRSGDVPDIVIFYDGINDIFSAYQNHEAGIPHNENQRRLEFRKTQTRKRRDYFMEMLANSSFIYNYLVSKQKIVTYVEPLNQEQLARDVLRKYQQNISVVKELGKSYGFKSYFFWQPLLFDKKFRTAYEQNPMQEHKYLNRFIAQCREEFSRELLSASPPSFIDLTNLFSQHKRPVFLDYCHTGMEGNKIIADEIIKQILIKGQK